jgi:dipeptidyl aminopeptidase/acylaminoacyl peptidase
VVAACGAAQPSAGDKGDRVGLAFERESGKRRSVWVAHEDGSGEQLFLTGNVWGAEVSPDGRRLLYKAHRGDDETGDLYVHDFATDDAALIGRAREAVWSPDGELLAVDDGNALVLIDLEKGKRRELVRGDVGGWWWGFSFSPDGESLAYVRGEMNLHGTDEYRADVFTVRLSDGKTTQLTRDGRSDRPVWGKDWIAYRQFRFIDGFIYIGEVRLMRPDGADQHLLARGAENVSRGWYGLEPLEFSEDGKRLLACAPRDIVACEPVVVTVPDGERRQLSVKGKPEIFAEDFARDGSEVLVHAGAMSETWSLYAVPFDGGPARLLAENVSGWGSWAR